MWQNSACHTFYSIYYFAGITDPSEYLSEINLRISSLCNALIKALILSESLSFGLTATKFAYGELSSSNAIESFLGDNFASIAKFELIITASPSLASNVDTNNSGAISFLI